MTDARSLSTKSNLPSVVGSIYPSKPIILIMISHGHNYFESDKEKEGI